MSCYILVDCALSWCLRSVQERRRSICILLAGTSGTGKSTLAGLLAARLGITTLVSTDSVRLFCYCAMLVSHC